MDKQPTTASTAKAILFAGLGAAILATLGGLLVTFGGEASGFGVTMFLILPIATGFCAASYVPTRRAALLATLLAVVSYFAILLFTGLEGIVCIIMAAPLILVGAAIGAILGTMLIGRTRGFFDDRVHSLLWPPLAILCVIGGTQLENSWGPAERVETFTTTCVLETTPEKAWKTIQEMKEVSAPQPFLLQIGLPVPKSCTLEGTGVGAKRICHFDSGVIEEEVTLWNKPHQLDLRITHSTLPGRHWLYFVSASYVFEELAPGKTLVTRTTTISSKLRPAWYWSFFENRGVQAEHHCLFESVQRSLPNQ